MTNENGEAGRERGKEGAGGLHCAECNKPMEHAPGIGAYCREHGDGPAREDTSASAEPQRAFGPIQEAADAMRRARLHLQEILTFDRKDSRFPSDQDLEAASLKLSQAITSLLALLGEAPPKAEHPSPNGIIERAERASMGLGGHLMQHALEAEIDALPDLPAPGATVQPQADARNAVRDFITDRFGIDPVDAGQVTDGILSIQARFIPRQPPHQGEAT